MTTPAFPHGSGFSDDPGGGPPPHQHTVTLSAPGDLLASVPALLGFRPARSIVAVCLSGERNPSVGAVMRHDPAAISLDKLSAIVEEFEELLTAHRPNFATCSSRRGTAPAAPAANGSASTAISYCLPLVWALEMDVYHGYPHHRAVVWV